MPTRYTVVSTTVADNQLASIWLNSPGERVAITRAAYQLETGLRYDPEQKGVPDPTTTNPLRRVWSRYPLRIFFEVSEPDRLVRILNFVKLTPSP